MELKLSFLLKFSFKLSQYISNGRILLSRNIQFIKLRIQIDILTHEINYKLFKINVDNGTKFQYKIENV